MSLWQALILGLTQGLTEFLPVSSSGHLTLLQRVFGIDIGGAELFFDIILHIGTLLAVCIVFYKDILALFKKPYKNLLYLIAATVPAAVVGLLFDDFIQSRLMNGSYTGYVLAAFFMLTAAALLAAELYAKRRREAGPLGWRTTLSMSVAQAAAILPGISRSGSTVVAGIFSGGRAEEVSHFSFLMSAPVILGSFFVELIKGLTDKQSGLAYSFQVAGQNFGWCIAVGFIVSAVAGLVAIKIMLKAIKNANYKWFSLYLALLSCTCIALQSFGYFA